ncbi:MAG: pyridoxamine 5'-phosphate oxidase family protein [Pyrinomonadaceae bacterium]|nr:pyridoxamine 5'-phosphate oxidase family protein [Pyrinomonadaceae bacterium]
MSEFPKTERNQVRRVAKRGKYDRKTIYKILDAGYLCHVGFAVDQQPFVIPTLYARIEDSIIVHGSSISRMLKNLEKGVRVCVTVTLVDGIVLARSAFHHSMNYRSVCVFGTGRLVEDQGEKIDALKAVSDNLLENRWEDSRPPNQKELNVTSVIKIDIEEASAKIREGDPIDDASDYELPIWAGVLPIITEFGEPQADSKLSSDIDLPEYLER